MSGKLRFERDWPPLTPSQAVMLTDWLWALAHEVELYYVDEIRSHQQAEAYQRENCR